MQIKSYNFSNLDSSKCYSLQCDKTIFTNSVLKSYSESNHTYLIFKFKYCMGFISMGFEYYRYITFN